MDPKPSKGKGVASSSQCPKKKDWFKRHQWRKLVCHNNHHNDLNSVGSRNKKIEEEVVDYRSRYDLKGLDVTKTKKPEGIHGPVLSISFEEPFDDDDLTDDEKARIDSDLEFDGDDGEYSEMGEAAYAPTDDED
ncbi:hypothetical protein HAX54_046340 [Datura stramonium]|uniref:Uncharacterized protein n=1 Tax=Datura stramonium TaxID=4076 RepID=A0ABS8SS02_DATST|nr:hypothetical protein [Datura stramonium]